MDTGNFSSGPAPESFSQPSTPEPSPSAAPVNGEHPQAPNGAAGPRPNQGGGRNRRRRNRRRRGGGGQGQNQPRQAQPQQNQRSSGGGNFRRNGQQNRGNGFSGPMDHSYRQTNGEINGNSVQGEGGRNQRFGRRFRQRFGGRQNQPVQPAPLPSELLEPLQTDDVTRIFAFIEDLFFVTKMNETARKLNVKLAFVKTADELLEKVDADQNGNQPSLIIFDLNNVNAKPLSAIPKLKTRFKKGASIIGFVPHVQGDLKVKAQEAGCDSVMPRSAFSQNLPQLLRRYGAPDETGKL